MQAAHPLLVMVTPPSLAPSTLCALREERCCPTPIERYTPEGEA